MKIFKIRTTLLLQFQIIAFFTFLIGIANLSAQDAMRVVRCSAIDQRSPITNIYVDEANNKWVATSKAVYQIQALDLANPLKMNAGEQSLLSISGGNQDIKWSADALKAIIGADNTITAGFYDIKKQELWIGTQEAGAFQLKVNPQLKLLNKFDNSNSKLKANEVNSIFIDKLGEVWIGTEEGAMVGKNGRWALEERLLSIGRITQFGSDVWLLGNNAIWRVNGRGDWIPVDVDADKIEGDIRDMVLDSLGRIWIASEVITRFDPDTDTYTFFGPIQYFTSQFATRLVIDKDGAVWVGTEDKGVYLIEKESSITVNALVEKELGCNATQNDASVKIKITGGKPPFTYAWTGGLAGENPKNLGPGDYTVTVTDSEGKTKSANVKIENPRFTVQVAQDKEESPGNTADGVASVTIVGNATDFTFKWDNGETTKIAKKLTTGNHTVTVTDKKGCSAIGNVTIGQQLSALTIAIEQVNPIKCNGESNSALKVNVSGGKPPFQYKWNDAKITGDQPTGLAAGNYQLQVTDATGGSSSALISIKSPEALSATIQAQAPASTGKSDAKAMAQVKGGSGNYTYKWDNGETTATAIKLSPGKHNLTITDANGCTTSTSIDITENVLPLAVAITEKSSTKCAGKSTAALAVQVTGGKAPFDYKWSDTKLDGDAPSGLMVGTYQLTVTDAAGNKSSASIAIKFPDALSATIQVQAPATTGNADGKAVVNAKGGVGNYTYKWDNGETTQMATKLAPGTHTVIITDANGCDTNATIEITENILPLAVNIIEKTMLKCAGANDASLAVQISGGKAPFQYMWNDAKISGDAPSNLTTGTYQVTVTDATGKKINTSFVIKAPEAISATINVQAPASTGNTDGKVAIQAKGGAGNYTYKWDNGETTQMATKLAPGKHTVTISDANGCIINVSTEVNENILPLNIAIAEKTSLKCASDQTASLTTQVNGGKPPFQYQWNDAKISGDAPSNLAAGTYQLTVTDAAGTKANTTFTIKAPEAITATIQVQAPASTGNSDGKAIAQAKGGAGNYTYKWDNSETTAAASKLAPGKHSITVTDANGCATTASLDIFENILPLALNIIEKAKVGCNGASDGGLQVQVSGGKLPFQYQWNNAKATGDQPTGLTAGAYEVSVTDATGNSKTIKYTIAQPTALEALVGDVKMATSLTITDGKATVLAKGGTGTYTYKWTNGETTATATKLAPGNNSVTVTDANGCTAIANFETSQRILAALSGTVRSGQTIRMEQLQFEADSSIINTPSLPVLNELYEFLQENPAIFVEIGGHTNSLPPDEVCDRLSAARAKSVVEFLNQKGIAESRLSYKGYGKRVPIADNNTPEGRQQNQRVEVKILRVGRPKESGG